MFTKRRKHRVLSPRAEGLAIKIAGWINKLQSAWATQSGKAFNRLTPRSRWAVLIAFIIGMAGLCSYSIVDGLINPQIRSPANFSFSLPANTGGRYQNRLDQKENNQLYERIHRFKLSLDSMALTASGRVKRDSLLRKRPGLLDSLRLVEEYYKN